eukprot:1138735-Pelagomonas_calceolata.AAC.1
MFFVPHSSVLYNKAADTRNMANFKTCAPRVLRHPPCAMMVVVCCEKCRRQKLQPQEESANPVQRQVVCLEKCHKRKLQPQEEKAQIRCRGTRSTSHLHHAKN